MKNKNKTGHLAALLTIIIWGTTFISTKVLKEEEKLHGNFFTGFLVAMTGIFLISVNGSKLQLNPMGDFLALMAAFIRE